MDFRRRIEANACILRDRLILGIEIMKTCLPTRSFAFVLWDTHPFSIMEALSRKLACETQPERATVVPRIKYIALSELFSITFVPKRRFESKFC